ncbi:hypothetical protein Syn7502_02414 [Synechococcus sp. PCC 7502]|uniref:hypothetical protein n=1 Tax=Synechococcus sp. PCC 7502 TaxID=1173263 RepID=UPI00029FD335|nr:hypothetical protein [Synechococcus sp. PCC 7502]AFY74399.1 hypothetical protein Syn7502_02414 [Synechococcus sp. PCC 7502]
MPKLITIIYALALIGNSIWKYQASYTSTKASKDVGSLVFEVVAGLALLSIAFSMDSSDLNRLFLSYYLALGISLVLVIFFSLGLWQKRTIYSIIQLSISLAFFIAGLLLLGAIS